MAALSVLFVPSCTERVAATRVRIHQFLPHLKEHGVAFRVLPMAGEGATRDMIMSPAFSPARRLLHYARLLAEKALRTPAVLLLAARYKVVFIQRATFFPGVEALLKAINPNIVFDFDDSIFIADPDSASGVLGALKNAMRGEEFGRIVRASKLILANNEFLKDQAKPYNERVLVFHEAIDTDRHAFKPKAPGPVTVIGWIGSPSTAAYLKFVEPALKRLARTHKIKLKVVGAGPSYVCPGVEVERAAWSLATEAAEVATFDIGIMPQPTTVWAEGKWGTKMLQYHATGIPGVATYSKANAELLHDGVNGFFAAGEDEWVEKLKVLIESPELRRKMGEAGREQVDRLHSVRVRKQEFVDLLKREFP
jgi:glycosyltransferase involved in cell wall biosynthesis